MRVWTFNPHVGGVRIPPLVQQQVRARLERHAAKHYAGRYSRLEIRFRGALCFVDAYREPRRPELSLLRITGETEAQYSNRLRKTPVRLGRLRYFGADRWSYSFYTYSNERYEPATFPNGDWFGKPEEAFDIGASYLTGD